MQKKFQIFVSSTFEDLKDERRAVIEAILDLGHIPIGMEAFQASNEEQWSYIEKRIDESDYYVVIVAERYGSANSQGISYTEMEYDYARKKGVPVAAFLLHDEARSEWRKAKADSLDNRQKLDAFRAKCQGLMVRYWCNKDDLAAACIKSLSLLFSSFPRDGWVPAKVAMQPEVASELARLSNENEKLRNLVIELQEPRNTNSDDKKIIKIKNRMDIEHIELSHIKVLFNGTEEHISPSLVAKKAFKPELTWLESIHAVGAELLGGLTVEGIDRSLSQFIAARLGIEMQNIADKYGKESRVLLNISGLKEFITFTEMNSLVSRVETTRELFGGRSKIRITTFYLTEFGKILCRTAV